MHEAWNARFSVFMAFYKMRQCWPDVRFAGDARDIALMEKWYRRFTILEEDIAFVRKVEEEWLWMPAKNLEQTWWLWESNPEARGREHGWEDGM